MECKVKKIDSIIDPIRDLIKKCALCAHKCGVDRTVSEIGQCQTSCDMDHVRISSHNLHFGEETALVGHGGSGTVFFTYCNLHCVFCQNYDISQLGLGSEIHYKDLSQIFLSLQGMGAENINLVTPTHYAFPIMIALRHAYRRGLTLPLVYNTGGYDNIELIRLLDGIVDIYLPDMKYMNPGNGLQYSGAKDYPKFALQNLKEMFKQVGPLQEKRGVAEKGLIIRHLILPNNIAGTHDFLDWLKENNMQDATVNLMRQYSPQYRTSEFPELNARISQYEYQELLDCATELGFENILTQ